MFGGYVELSDVIPAADAQLFAPQRKSKGEIITKRFASDVVPVAVRKGVAPDLESAVLNNNAYVKRVKNGGETIISRLHINPVPDSNGEYYLSYGPSIVKPQKLALNAPGPRGEKAQFIAQPDLNEAIAALKYAIINAKGKETHHMNEIDSSARYVSALPEYLRPEFYRRARERGFYFGDDRRNQVALYGSNVTGALLPDGTQVIPSNYSDEHQTGVHRIMDVNSSIYGLPNTNLAEGSKSGETIESKMEGLSDHQKLSAALASLENGRLAVQEQKGISPSALNRTEAALLADIAETKQHGPVYIHPSLRDASPGDNQDRSIIVNSEGGDVSIGESVQRKNGNGHSRSPRRI